MIEIGQKFLDRIFEHAKESYPYECCGILIGQQKGNKKVQDLVETANLAERFGRSRYRIDGRDYLRADHQAKEKGLEIIGFYHSHPGVSSLPSATDQELAWEGFSYLIISLKAGEAPDVRSWVLEENRIGWIEETVHASGRKKGKVL